MRSHAAHSMAVWLAVHAAHPQQLPTAALYDTAREASPGLPRGSIEVLLATLRRNGYLCFRNIPGRRGGAYGLGPFTPAFAAHLRTPERPLKTPKERVFKTAATLATAKRIELQDLVHVPNSVWQLSSKPLPAQL